MLGLHTPYLMRSPILEIPIQLEGQFPRSHLVKVGTVLQISDMNAEILSSPQMENFVLFGQFVEPLVKLIGLSPKVQIGPKSSSLKSLLHLRHNNLGGREHNPQLVQECITVVHYSAHLAQTPSII